MADNPRTRADLLSLLADNTTGDISAQDLRDFVMSIVPAFGHIRLATPAATTISNTGVYYKMAGSTSAGDLYSFTSLTSGRLTLSASVPVRALILCSGSISCGTAGQTVAVRLGIGGLSNADAETTFRLDTASEPYAFSVNWIETLQPNDYVELFVRNTTATNDLTVESFTLTIIGLMAQA